MAQLASAMHVLARATPHPVAMSSGSDASSRHRVFVYGTLKRGFYNHRLLQEREAKFVGNASTREPMRLVLGEYGIPYLMKGEGNTAVPGELWEVDDAGLDALDVLEGIDEGMYERVTLDVNLMDDGGGRDETTTTTSAQAYVCGPESERRGVGTTWSEEIPAYDTTVHEAAYVPKHERAAGSLGTKSLGRDSS